ncbi:MAG TPA: hypothetical protein VK864_17685, partial [Longimicrobiales bacterium]|nr:hypothetical protein [Longimicrobiales bacterium]
MSGKPTHRRALKPMHALRLAARGLGRSPGIVITAALTLGVGLSAAVMLLGVIDSGARSLPVPQGQNIVQVRVHDAQARRIAAPAPIASWAVGAGIDAAGALEQTERTFSHPALPALRAPGAAMHTSVLRLLQVLPAFGRLPTDDPADASAVVLSWKLWQDLGADR